MLKKIDFTSYKTILLAALIFRLIASILSQGYGMHDDHFLIIEAASSWSDGFDYNNWLPWSPENKGYPDGHSFSYVGLNYVFFVIFKFFGCLDPKLLMIFNRLFHALFSMLTVYFGMKITEKYATKKEAVTVGWILALLWLFPFLAVRNLVEMTCVPFLMWGVWLIFKDKNLRSFLLAGLLVGMAVSFRYQVGVFAFGIATYYFFRWEWKKFALFCLGVVLTFSLTQGVVDYFIWGYPFAELSGYIIYNMHEGTQYMANTNYFMYFYVIFGILLVPLGLLLAFGIFSYPKKQWTVMIPAGIMLLLHIYLAKFQGWFLLLVFTVLLVYALRGKFRALSTDWLIYLPTLFFILFHTFYPNRQERFVLSVVPFVIILGIVAIYKLRTNPFWDKTWIISWRAFWVLNIPLLLFFTFTSTKKSRIDAMYALHDKHIDYQNILLEASGKSSTSLMPKFYANSWHCTFAQREEPTEPMDVYPGSRYDYIFFFGEDLLQKRIHDYQKMYPKMRLIKRCEPSTIDKVLFKLNPKNTNQYIEVWKTNR